MVGTRRLVDLPEVRARATTVPEGLSRGEMLPAKSNILALST
jgi:hypothetical protein